MEAGPGWGPACAGSRVLAAWGMDLSGYRKMDPHLLVGLVNTELRNHCDSLDDLVKTHGLDHTELVSTLGGAGYEYRAEQNQFR
jgi:hypothetical protein